VELLRLNCTIVGTCGLESVAAVKEEVYERIRSANAP
jgi:hypothetical protein